MASKKSFLAQELSKFYQAAWLDLPAEAAKSLLGAGNEKELHKAGWKIETGEKLATQTLELQAKATGWAKDTPFAPLFEAQTSFARKFVERSANAARTLWQIRPAQYRTFTLILSCKSILTRRADEQPSPAKERASGIREGSYPVGERHLGSEN